MPGRLGETSLPAKPSRSWSVPAFIGAALLIAVAAYIALRPRRSPEEITRIVADAQNPHDSPIFIRGEATNKGPVVPRRFLAVASGP